MDPGVFRAPDRLPDQILRMTEVGCTTWSTFQYSFLAVKGLSVALNQIELIRPFSHMMAKDELKF